MRILFDQSGKLVPTAFKLLMICGLAVVLPASVVVQPQVVLVNDVKPFQVWTSEHVPDQGHPPDLDDIRLKSDIGAATEEHNDPIFQLPLRRGIANTDPGIFGISDFVDHDEDSPESDPDYNCGNRTFDNHDGTDYRNPTFPRYTMANDGLIAIAAADGVIIFKHDGESDSKCGFGSPESNRIWLLHADGSFTNYANCKQDTLTAGQVGDVVEAGDYLCVVGNSGLSSTPQLHLGVRDSSENLNDPYAGECNSLNQDTLWLDQEAYEVETINLVATHDAPPERPPCPEPEVPHFEDEFASGDRVWMSAFVRDFTFSDKLIFEIMNPMGQTVLQTEYVKEVGDPPFSAALSVLFAVDFSATAPDGVWTLAVTYDSANIPLKLEGKSTPNNHNANTEEHTFLMNTEALGPPDPVPENNAYSGLYYDPSLDGEGYNIIPNKNGTLVYFYGNDSEGNRLWLVSAPDPFYGPIIDGEEIKLEMWESTGGVFAEPNLPSRALAYWGDLTLIFTDCANGTATLVGKDGSKVSQIVKIGGIAGTGCPPGGDRPETALSGLHYDPGKDGEGYSLIVTPLGSVLYYYGMKRNPTRLWLASALIREVLSVGVDVVTTVYEATRGTFDRPVASSIMPWGTATITVIDCDHATIMLDGFDGTKTSNTVVLAGIIGLECTN